MYIEAMTTDRTQHTFARIQRPKAQELSALFTAVGWGEHSEAVLEKSISAYPCTVCARTLNGELVGYLSAFSDKVMSTVLGELLVNTDWRRQGVAKSMLAVLERQYPDAPIYIKALGESRHFYEAVGFKVARAEVTVLFKTPAPRQARKSL
jgi:GNAT superfamily N-acetyltransferase